MRSHLRGVERILSSEIRVSDLLQELTDLDPTPWTNIVGIEPSSAEREHPLRRLDKGERTKGNIDLLLKSKEGYEVALELKISHIFDDDQRKRYEISTNGALHLLGMAADSHIVDDFPRWNFHVLADVIDAWQSSTDSNARYLARNAAQIIRKWDSIIESTFSTTNDGKSLDAIEEKFLAALVSHRLARGLIEIGWLSSFGKSAGNSGLAVASGFAPLNQDSDRCLISQVRWLEGLQKINFRFGIDFTTPETVETRAESWELAKNMSETIKVTSFHNHLRQANPSLEKRFIARSRSRRREPNDEIWLPVVQLGLKNKSNPNGIPGPNGENGTRSNNNPGFAGDGTLRFQESVNISAADMSARDLQELIDAALKYLSGRLPAGYGA